MFGVPLKWFSQKAQGTLLGWIDQSCLFGVPLNWFPQIVGLQTTRSMVDQFAEFAGGLGGMDAHSRFETTVARTTCFSDSVPLFAYPKNTTFVFLKKRLHKRGGFNQVSTR